MKKILFISKSQLSKNLFVTLIPLFRTSVEFEYIDSLDQSQIKRGKNFDLVVVDANVFDEESDFAVFISHRRLANAKKIGFYSDQFSIPDQFQNNFDGQFKKPFLPTEMVEKISEQL